MKVALRIGGVSVAVHFPQPVLFIPLSPSLKAFAVESPQSTDLTIEVLPLEVYVPPRGPLLFDSGVVWTLYEDESRYRIECRSPLYGEVPYKIVDVERDFARATVRVRDLGGRFPDALEYPVDEMLLNAFLTANGGLEVHACGVIDDDGSGYLFVGNSGDGKTTTARLWQQERAEIVSDDRVILREDEDGWWMYGTPWHGEAGVESPNRAPLRQVFLIDRSLRSNSASPVPRAVAIARILACAFPPFHDRAGLRGLIETIDHVASAVPVTRFSFSNDAGAVAFARRLAGMAR